MGRKQVPSLDELSAVIGVIHDAGVDAASWPEALKRIGALFDGPTVAVWTRDATGTLESMAAVRPDPQAGLDYARHYHTLDRLNPVVARNPVGAVLTNGMVIPRSEFVRTAFYADFARRYDADEAMQGNILEGPAGSGYLGVVRPWRIGAFEIEDTRLLRLLLPHVRRAMQTQLRLASLGVQRDSALEALNRLPHGVLIVDAQARVIYANGAAEAVLRNADGLGVDASGQRLHAIRPGRTDALRRLIAQAAGRGGTPAGGGDGVLRLDRAVGPPLLVSVAPVRAELSWNTSQRPAALVLIGGGDVAVPSSPGHLRALYGLTAAEAAVAQAISRGDGAKAAAERLGITPATLRWHLRRVFEKTGTARQAELARLVERLGTMGGEGRG